MRKIRVFGGKRRKKRIGKVKACVFHPSEKRCVGFMVKRPDLLWMFHRKDLFVALDGFDLEDGHIVVKDAGEMTGPAACKRLGIDWDSCVLWEGMPLMTADGTAIGYVGKITFSLRTGEIESVVASNGATAKYLLGVLEVPAEYIKGFKRGMGATLAVKNDTRETGDAVEFTGAILVSDDVWELQPEGGWAESAGEFTAKAKARVHDAAEKARPKVQEATQVAGAAINEGAYAVGQQVAASKGMFSSFKEEYNKARHGEDEERAIEAPQEDPKTDTAMSNMFSSFKDEFDKARGVEEKKAAAPSAEDDSEESNVTGMFSSFKEEFDKARTSDAVEDDDSDEEEVLDEEELLEEEEIVDDDDYEDEDEEEEPKPRPAKKKQPAQKQSGVSGMFAAFKEEYDKARYDD